MIAGPATSFAADPIFGVAIPEACPGVPSEVLQPRSTWQDPAAYDQKARQLAKLFQENFKTHAFPESVADFRILPGVLEQST